MCLRCRHEQAQATQRRRQRFFMQFLGLASVVGILVVAGVGAANTLRNEQTSETTSGGSIAADVAPVKPVKTSPVAAVVQQQSAPATPAPEPAAQAATPAPARPLPSGGFVIVEGRTKLTDSIFAVRTGDSVVVNFDAFGYRTRRASKLEQSLRATLPLIMGRTATASLDTLAAGAVVANRDVVGALAHEGMDMELDNGVTAHNRVLTRPVTDGPIAIGYLITLRR